MKIIDLSHTVTPGMPVYPGTEPPLLIPACTLEADGFIEQKLVFYSHTGTHIDAPAHILAQGPTLDRMPVDSFVGRAFVIDLTAGKRNKIDIADLEPHEPLFKKSEFVLLHTGWSRYWGRGQYFRDYPVLSVEAALWLNRFGLKGVGVDVISVDEAGAADLAIHKILLGRSIVIENLTHLEQLPKTGFIFSCLPLKLENADGSPVRAVGMV